ncbi:hypothetical protein [Streptomyces sp. UG1]|uniref:hypothetical protein n=1 Tax=Streptomyces sp. UG1 TaxID=3417652 RepID=UPI003CF9A5C3
MPLRDDLRDGKQTALIAVALDRADPAQRRILRSSPGDPNLDNAGAERIRAVLADTRARDAVEELIEDRCSQALATLEHAAPFPPAAIAVLRQLAAATSRRTT